MSTRTQVVSLALLSSSSKDQKSSFSNKQKSYKSMSLPSSIFALFALLLVGVCCQVGRVELRPNYALSSKKPPFNGSIFGKRSNVPPTAAPPLAASGGADERQRKPVAAREESAQRQEESAFRRALLQRTAPPFERAEPDEFEFAGGRTAQLAPPPPTRSWKLDAEFLLGAAQRCLTLNNQVEASGATFAGK